MLKPGHPHRSVLVLHHSKPFHVPMYIVRLDSSNSNGWQVRYRKQTKYFSDGAKPQLLDWEAIEKSLRLAVAHLNKIYAGRPVHASEISKARKESDLPPGIRRVDQFSKSRPNIIETYIEVSAIGPHKSPVRLYVGTQNTVTETRLSEKIQEALALRIRKIKDWKRIRAAM